MGVSKNREPPQNGWFIMEHPIKMDDLGVPLFSDTSIWRQMCPLCVSNFMNPFHLSIYECWRKYQPQRLHGHHARHTRSVRFSNRKQTVCRPVKQRALLTNTVLWVSYASYGFEFYLNETEALKKKTSISCCRYSTWGQINLDIIYANCSKKKMSKEQVVSLYLQQKSCFEYISITAFHWSKGSCQTSRQVNFWLSKRIFSCLVVEPTPLKNMLGKLGIFPKFWGWK